MANGEEKDEGDMVWAVICDVGCMWETNKKEEKKLQYIGNIIL